MKKFLSKVARRLVWAVLTLLAFAAWVALWVFIFSLLVGPLGYPWADMIRFWGIFLGGFYIMLRSFWVFDDLRKAGQV